MIAVSLSPKARALIRANRDVRRPTVADRERVAAALRARLGPTVLPIEIPIAAPLISADVQRWFASAFGVCIVGSVVFLAQRAETAHESQTQTRDKSVEVVPSAIPTSVPSPMSAGPETPVTHQPKTAAPAPRHASAKVALPPAAQDTLAQELALLTGAASQLNSGRASAALLALDEHQRRFSHGVLSDERNVAKARALCALRRFEEGRAALARLPAGTPAAARVKEECDSAWARANATQLSREP